jgi:hypothetical protein
MGCTTLMELAARIPLGTAAGASGYSTAPADTAAAGRQPEGQSSGSAAAGSSGVPLDLRQLEADAAAVAVCVQQLAATRRWASTKEGGLRVQYLHEKGGRAP